MLDKSIEYKHVIMRLDCNEFTTLEPELPPGYSFRFFKPSDEKNWSRIETSVLEFDSEQAAENYFRIAYLPYINELGKRCVFILDPEGLPVATANAWYANSELGHQASLHWVAVRPEYQGKGLGKAITKKTLQIFHSMENGIPVWIHTQTWSHVAIRLYHSLGFNMVQSGRLADSNTTDGNVRIFPNDFHEAIQLMKSVMDAGYIEELQRTAV